MIGILGGTFDPIHLGHVEPARDLLQMLPLREIRFIPARIPPHRNPPLASAAHRWRMLELAIQDQPGLMADDRELRRAGPSYTVDTLGELHAELSEPLCLIIGMDAFANLTTWHRWQDILRLAHIVITTRPGASLPTTGAAADLLKERYCDSPQALTDLLCGGILPRTVRHLDISSSTIRAGIAAGKDVSAMLAPPVWRYIREHGLYIATSNEVVI
ncbi:MAG TPA: nicotinate-nucleotide adenylyltransferase [Gammaproteobacteria bacterium]|nr:nicotinate-nucleotide adenylyltransferase [Gammaproteobacteria bacterium]